jgi:HAD superfamily hydrolase (TIGR01509 family)
MPQRNALARSSRDWPAGVIFDFDGVIVNSEPLHCHAFRETASAEGIDVPEEEYWREYLGFDDRGMFQHLYFKHNRPLTPPTFLRVMTRKSEIVRELIERHKYQALPGAAEFVRAIWRNYPLAICSGALREEIEAMLEGVALRDCFSTIIAAEDVTIGKPDPQGYLKATAEIARRLGRELQPADMLIIEDAPKVIQSVRAAGFPVLAVATSHRPEALSQANWTVKSLSPDAVASCIPQLKMLVQ